jgi:3',5'-cyclic AMP phosphodiesterase CpdA
VRGASRITSTSNADWVISTSGICRRCIAWKPDLVVADLMAHRPDHIAVTGDLINLGPPAEYEAARACQA